MTDYSNTPREATRVPLAHRIQLKFDRFSGFINEYVSNLSPGGIFIRTDAPQGPGQLLDFEFRLGDGYELIRGRGEVVWARERSDGPDRPPGMGVRFIELSPGSKDLIYKIVDDYVAHGGKPFDLTPPPPAAPAVEAPPAARPLGATASPRAAAAGAPGVSAKPSGVATGRPGGSASPRVPAVAAPGAPADPSWTLDIPAIQPLPGVPAITPRSPLERLGAPAPTVAADPATPAMAAAPAPGTSAGGPTGPAGSGVSAAGVDGLPVHEDPWPAATAGADPLAQMAAALPPLDELAPDVPVLPGEDAGPQLVPAPPPVPASANAAPGLAIPGTATAALGPTVTGAESAVPGGAPAVPGASLAVPAGSGATSAEPGAPAAAPPGPTVSAGARAASPLFSSFDLRPSRRRSRLPLLAALVAVALLALAVWLLRDTAVAWMQRREAAQTAGAPPGAGPAGATATSSAVSRPPSPAPAPSAASPGAASAPPPAGPVVATSPAAPATGGSAAGAPAGRSAAPAPGTAAPVAAARSGSAPGNGSAPVTPAARAPGAAAGLPTGTPSGPAAGGAVKAAGSPAPGLAAAPGAASPAPRSAAASLLAANASPAAGRATAVERISWQQAGGGLVVVVWGNGEFPSQSYTRVRVGGLPVREVIRISGIDRPFASPRLLVRSQELLQIRTGYHPPRDLHLVLDLGGPDVQITDIEPGPHQLRIHLRR